MQQRESKQNIKYRLMAYINSLHINKNLKFETKVIWKRNVNKCQTENVVHQNGVSIFNQTLTLEMNLVYNLVENRFQEKYTQFSVVVLYQGKTKSGGYVKYDASEIVNKNFNDEPIRLNLLQCPDPNAYIEVTLNYQTVGQSSRSLFTELSLLNPTGMENDLSQIDFHDDQNRDEDISTSQRDGYLQSSDSIVKNTLQQIQMSRMNDLLNKMENMARKTRCNQKGYYQQDHNSTKSENLQLSTLTIEQQQQLKSKIHTLEEELQKRDQIIRQNQNKIKVQGNYIKELQLNLQKSQHNIRQLQDQHEVNRSIQVALMEREGEFKGLYQKTQKQLQLLKNSSGDMNFSKQSMGFNKFMQEVNEIEEAPQFQNDMFQEGNNQKIQLLERETVELQTKIASMSHSIAQLFNAAYDFGGASLLDYLQNSIGLIEEDLR